MSLTEITPAASTWTRRSFLGTLSALAVGTLTGCGLDGADLRQDLTGGPGGPKGTPGGPATSAWTGYGPTPPYTLSATPELSQDYFLVETHNRSGQRHGDRLQPRRRRGRGDAAAERGDPTALPRPRRGGRLGGSTSCRRRPAASSTWSPVSPTPRSRDSRSVRRR